MPRTIARTRLVTLHRLPTVSADDMENAIDAELADQLGADLHPIEVAGTPAVWVDGCLSPDGPAEWCRDASVTTGLDIAHSDRRSGGLLLLSVEDTVYAIGYGQQGFRLLLDEYKDPRFGLSFAVRALDPHKVCDLVRRFPSVRGRTDISSVPGGLPIFSFGIEPAEVVRRIGGSVRDIDLALGGQQRVLRIEGGAGLKVRLSVQPADLVSDIKTIAGICSRRLPDPDLRFIDHIQPIHDTAILAQLNRTLENSLRQALAGEETDLVPTVPSTCIGHLSETGAYRVKIGPGRARLRDHLDLDALLEGLHATGPGLRVTALRSGRVQMYGNSDGTHRLASAIALKWLEASCALEHRRFQLIDAQWYEIGQAYLGEIRARIEPVLKALPSLDLPAWRSQITEREYNENVPEDRSGYICLDRAGVRNPLRSSDQVEICDLLGPDDEFIHVKRAKSSAPLSHLFNQALVSIQTLAHSESARRQFAALAEAKGRILPPGFLPKKIVFAILLDNGRELTAGSLFPFSQVTLAHTISTLQNQYQIAVEVIGIART